MALLKHIYGTSNTGVAVDETVVTDKNGSVTIKLLTGTYTVEEVKIANRYVSVPKQTIKIENGKISTVTFNNILKKGKLIIEKVSSKNPDIKLSGALFTVFDNKGNKVSDLTETEEGIYTLSNLLYGSYTIKEITAPTGYLLDTGSYNFKITQDKQIVVISNSDDKKFVEIPIEGSIEILKVDSTNNKPLSGAEFTLYNENGDVVQKLTTGKDGKVTFKEVPYGKYTVKETKAPAYYELDDTAIPFEILENGKTLTVTKKDIPEYGKGTFIKTSEDGVVEGIKLHIYGTSNTGVAVDETVTTDAEGKANLKLLVGTYTVEEIKVADRYVSVPKQTLKIENGKTSTVTFNNILKKGKLIIEKVSSKNPDIKLTGAKFTVFDMDGNKISDLSETEKGIYTISNLVHGSYYVEEITAPQGYLLDKGSYKFEITQDNQVIIISNSDDGKFVEVPIEGNIEIMKVDSTNNKPLSGAEFTLYNANGDAIQTLTTGKDGKVTFKEVPYGKYTVKETKAPKYYELDDTTIPFEILENGKTLTATKTDKPEYGKGTFIKTSEDGIIEGVTLHIYGTSNTGVAVDETVVTDKNGSVTIKLLTGTYTVEEIKIADRYISVPTQTVKIEKNKTAEVKFNNILKKGSLQVYKIDSEYPDNKLSGAVFEVYDSNKNAVGTLTEIEKGLYRLDNIPYGDYTLKEITSPTGFLPDTNEYEFKIRTNGEVVTVETMPKVGFADAPIKGSFNLYKLDGDTQKPLQGAEFTLYDMDNTALKTAVTDENGYLEFTDIRYGSYYVKETKAPENYELDDNLYSFMILKHGKTIEYKKTNDSEKGGLEIIKKSDDGVVENVKFHIFGTSLTMQEIDEIVYTDTDGKILIENLLTGIYTVEELEVNDRYITPQYQTVVVSANETATVTFTNVLKRGSVQTTKVDKDYPENKLTGAVFEIFDSNQNSVGIMQEIEAGIYQLDELIYGDYTLKEITAPTGFQLDENEYPFEIRENGEVKVIETLAGIGFINNAQKGDLIIQKRSSDGKLEGFSFRVTGKAVTGQEYDQTFVTDKDGRIEVKDLRIGTYTVSEIADEMTVRYTLPADQTVEITADNTAEVEMYNDEFEIPFEITKSDISTGELIPNCGFRIRNSNGEIIIEGYTDENGVAKFELVCGEYTYQEFSAPDGYIIDENEYPFTINPDDTIVKADMTNVGTGTFEMIKTDISTGKPIPDTSFRIRNDKGEIIVEGKTDNNGTALFEKLPYGKYTYQEFDAPDGYIIDESEYPFEIKENNEVVKAEMQNIGTGTIVITKKDVSNGKVIPDCEIEILDENKQVLFRGKTDKNGVVEFEKLPYGKYFYREFNAPNGYILDERPFAFEIKENGEIIKAEMTNKPVEKTPGYITTNDNSMVYISILTIIMFISLIVIFLAFRKSSKK